MSTIIRALAFLIINLMLIYGSYRFRLQLAISLGLTHYILASIYSRKWIPAVFSRKDSSAVFIGMTIVGLIMAYVHGGTTAVLSITFLAHHVLTEAYSETSYRFLEGRVFSTMSWFSASRILLESSIVLAFVVYAPEVSILSKDWAFGLLAISCVLYMGMLFRIWHQIESREERWSTILLPLVSILSLFYFYWSGMIEKVRVLDVVLYHFIIWTVLPIKNWIGIGRLALSRNYLLLTVGFFSFFSWMVFPLTPWEDEVWQLYFVGFYTYGFVHIFTSLALSRSNPRILARYFGLYPR